MFRVEEYRKIYMVGWTAYVPSLDRYFWNGDTDLDFEGKIYEAAIGIEVKNPTQELSSPQQRATISFLVTEAQTRSTFSQDLGPTQVEVTWIYSADRGKTWQRVPKRFVGRISRSFIKDGVFTAELETYTGGVDRGLPKKWSHEAQMKRAPGGVDRFFEQNRSIESGVDTNYDWPT